MRELRHAGFEPSWQRVETRADCRAALHAGLDLVVADQAMPQFSGLEALDLLTAKGLAVPFILVSGSIAEEVAVEALKRGATDYLMKNRMARFGPAVKHALEWTRMRREQANTWAALQASEELFRQVVESIHEVLWLKEAAGGRILYFSPSVAEVWGQSRETLYAEPARWHEAVHPHDRDRVARAAATRQILGTYDETYRIVRPDGSERWIRERAMPVVEGWDVVRRIVGTAEDITERHQIEEQLRHAQKMEAIGTLAGGIAHDFNNILAAIGGCAELAQQELAGNTAVGEQLDAIEAGVRHATGLVRQILLFSRRDTLDRHPVLLRPVVLEALTLLRATVPATITFETELNEDAPVVLADATGIQQVVMNLGVNAWHAMKDEAGKITVKLGRVTVDAGSKAAPEGLRPGNYARLSVGDNGCGMDATVLRRIYEPFFTTKPRGEGTGLGLAVVHGIVASHGGLVVVESRPGRGTVFDLYFPEHVGAALPAPVEPRKVPQGRGQKILVVDDEATLVRMGEKRLAALGYNAVGTTEPARALAWVQADPRRFDLVLTDQTMPKMTGLELARRLRKIRPDLPVVLMTGQGSVPDQTGPEGVVVEQVLLKPVTLPCLREAMHGALLRRKTL